MDNSSEYHNASNMVIGNNPLFTKNELDWFDFETRVRRIIYDLLLPVNTRMKEVKDSNDQSRQVVHGMERNISDFKMSIKHQDQRIRMIEEIGKRLQKLEEEQCSIDQKVHGITKNVLNLQQQMMAFQGSVNVQVHTLEKNFNRQGFHDYINDLMESLKNDYMREMIQQNEDKERNLQQIRESVGNYENLVKGFEARAISMNEDLTQSKIMLESQNITQRKLQDRTKLLKDQMSNIKDKLEGGQGLDQSHKQVQMRISFLENYIMNTIPMQTQSIVQKTLSHTLSSKKDQHKASQFFQLQIKNLIEQQRKTSAAVVNIDSHNLLGGDRKLSEDVSNKSEVQRVIYNGLNRIFHFQEQNRIPQIISSNQTQSNQMINPSPQKQPSPSPSPQPKSSIQLKLNNQPMPPQSDQRRSSQLFSQKRTSSVSQNQFHKDPAQSQQATTPFSSMFQNLLMSQNNLENEIKKSIAQFATKRTHKFSIHEGDDRNSQYDDNQSQISRYDSYSQNRGRYQSNKSEARNNTNQVDVVKDQENEQLFEQNLKKVNEDKNDTSTNLDELISPTKNRKRGSSKKKRKNKDNENSLLQEKGSNDDSANSKHKKKPRYSPSLQKQRTFSQQKKLMSVKDPRRQSVLNSSQFKILESGATPMRQLFMNLKLESNANEDQGDSSTNLVDDAASDDKTSHNETSKQTSSQDHSSSQNTTKKKRKHHHKKHHRHNNDEKKFKLLNQQEKIEEIKEDDEEDNSNSVSGSISNSESDSSGSDSDEDSFQSDSYSDSSLNEKVKSEFRQLQIRIQDLEEKVTELDVQLHSQNQDQITRLDQSKTNIELVVENLRDEIVQITHRWHRFKTDNELFSKELQGSVAKAREESRTVRSNNETVLDLFQLMQESIKILISLQVQDEKDRASISLVGQKTHTVKGNANCRQNVQSQQNSPRLLNAQKGATKYQKYIELDPQCISCSQNVTEIKTAYKIACLSYKPSNVEYKNTNFERSNLIQLLNFVVDETDVLDRNLQRVSHEHKIIMSKLLNRMNVWQNEKIHRSLISIDKLPGGGNQMLLSQGSLINSTDGFDQNRRSHSKIPEFQSNNNVLMSNTMILSQSLLKPNQAPLNEQQEMFVKNRRKRHLRNFSQSGMDTYDMLINKTPNISPLGHQILAPFIEQETNQLKKIRRQRDQLIAR
eukprot:403362306